MASTLRNKDLEVWVSTVRLSVFFFPNSWHACIEEQSSAPLSKETHSLSNSVSRIWLPRIENLPWPPLCSQGKLNYLYLFVIGGQPITIWPWTNWKLLVIRLSCLSPKGLNSQTGTSITSPQSQGRWKSQVLVCGYPDIHPNITYDNNCLLNAYIVLKTRFLPFPHWALH